MTNVVELKDYRADPMHKLIEEHRTALADMICAYAVHMNVGDVPSFESFLDAQERFVMSWHAVNNASDGELSQ